MSPCKHLDHSDKYAETCKLQTIERFSETVKYWERQHLPYEGAPRDVHFCGQGRGRINGIVQCYNGEMSCYEPEGPIEEPCADCQAAKRHAPRSHCVAVSPGSTQSPRSGEMSLDCAP